MNKLTDWIKRHQVAAFFIIAFAITWGLGFSYDAVLNRNQYLLLPVMFASVCGPAFAGIIVSAVINAEPIQGPRSPFWITFWFAWLVSGIVCVANYIFINHASLSPAAIGLFAVAVVPVALVIGATHSRIPAVRGYLASLIRLRGVWGWALLAFVGASATILLAVPVSVVLSGRPISATRFPDASPALIGLVAVKFFYQLFFFNATGEETGWRGFALPRLQSRTSPLIAALIIGVFWTLWHLLGWQAEGRPIMTVAFWVQMFTGHLLLSVLIVWICNRAKGSILVAGIAHAAVNTAQAFVANQVWGICLVCSLIALVLILVDRMWQKLPSDHPAVYLGPLAAQGDRVVEDGALRMRGGMDSA